MPVEPYDVIYADPPWRYSFSRSRSRSIDAHYPTMKLADIKAMQRLENLGRDVEHIELAVREVGVRQRLEASYQLCHHLIHRPLGIHPLGPDDPLYRVQE